MNSNRINVTLGFNADVGAAKANLKDLQATLNEISNLKLEPGTNLNKSLQEAISSADILQQHLNAAMDVKTGNINVDKFTASISKSGQSVLQLGNNLLKAGMTGEKAFTQLQNGLTMANIKLTKSTSLLGQFAKTLANTARWQISSTILHGFMGALQSAYGYAQDLNKSLTRIQIVTQQTTEQMDAFAERANKAAKALSASTLAYTDAALIYYQQGLDDSEVEERTNVTVKMMNVTGKSAEEISSQMTAIWNNFDNGTKSLEYYADAITALGAKTAASSAEIADGLQKFASVADTVGLSYEYATAALATVVAKTRESADVIGTSFKTIFARLQGLSLGETLEDGVDLNKYSKELVKVGVNVLDANSQLRDMDDILDDLGERWKTLTEAQKTALAETVGGMRQYAKFMALMNNWEDVKSNVQVASSSGGTLQEQADIYAKSWEAAKKRVKASLEELYSTLIDDKFFIGLTDTLGKVISLVTTLAKGMGGVSGILMFVANILMTKFAPQITMALNSGIEKISHFSLNLKSLVNPITTIKDTFILMGRDSEQVSAVMARRTQELGKALEASATSGQQLAKELNYIGTTSTTPLTAGFQAQQLGLKEINGLVDVYQGNYAKLTEQERQLIQGQLTELVNLNNNVAAAHDMVEELESQRDILRDMASFDVVDQANYDTNSEGTAAVLNVSGVSDELRIISSLIEDTGANVTYVNGQAQQIQGTTTELGSVMANVSDEIEDSVAVSQDLGKILEHVTLEVDKTGKLTTKGDKTLRQIYGSLGKTSKSADILVKRLQRGSISVEQFQKHLKNLPNITARFAKQMGLSDQKIQSALKNGRELNNAQKKLTQETNNYNSALTKTISTLSAGVNKAISIGGQIQGVMQGLNGLAMSVNAIRNAFSTFQDENASFWDKFAAGTMGGVMALSGVMSAMNAMNNILNSSIVLNLKNVATKGIENTVDATKLALQKQLNTEEGKNAILAAKKLILQKAETGAKEKDIIAETTSLIAKQTGLGVEESEIVAKSLLTSATEANIIATSGETVALVTETGATAGATAAQWSLNAAIYANPVGAIVLAIMAFIAALAALIAIIVIFCKQEDEAAKKEKAAAVALEESKEAAKKAHEAYDELYATVSKYKDAVKALKECTKGTEEWRDAFQEVNKQAQEILTKYPELLKYDNIFNSDGTLNIERLDEAVNKLEKVAQAADNLVIRKQNELNLATTNREASDLKKNLQSNVSYREYYARDDYGQYTYAASNYSIAGKVADKIRDEGIDVKNTKDLDDAIRKVAQDMGVLDDDLDTVVTDIHASLDPLTGDFINLATETENTVQAMINSQRLLANKLFGEDAQENAALAGAEVEAYNEYVANQRSDYEAAVKYAHGHHAGGDDNVDQMLAGTYNRKGQDGKLLVEMARSYAANIDSDLAGYEIKKDDAIKWHDGEAYIQFINAAGEKVERKVEAMADAVAEYDATMHLDEIKNTGEQKYKERLERMGTAGTTFLTNENLQGIAYKDIQTSKSFEEIFGDDNELKNTLAAKYGIKAEDVTAEMISNFKKKYQDSIEGVTEAYNNVTSSVIGQVLGDGVNELTVETMGSINTLHKQLTAKTDNNSAAGIETALAQLGKDNAEHMQDIMNIASSIDWGNPDALEQFNTLLAAQNIQLDTASESYKNFASSLKNMPITVSPVDYQAIRKQFQTLKEAAEDIKIGSIISDDTYQKIIETNEALKTLFVQTADGYAYIGSQDLGSIIKKDFQENVRGNIERAQTALIGINESDNWGWRQEDGSFKQIDYKNIGQQIKNGNGPTWANTWLGTLANDDHAEELAAIAGVTVDKFKELASKSFDELTEEEREAVANIYTSIGEHQGDLDLYKQNITDGLIQLGSSYDSYAAGLAAINAYAGQEEISDEQIQAAIIGMTNAAIVGADSLEKLDSVIHQIAEAGQTVDYSIIASQLINLASQYDNCSQEIHAYQNALLSSSEEVVKAAENNLRASIMIGEAAQKYGLEADVLEEQAIQIASAYGITKKEAAQLAIKNERMNKGVLALNENWEDWSKTLKESNKLSKDYAQTITQIRSALQDLLAVSDDFNISSEFIEDHLDDITKASNGDTDAIARLGNALAKANIQALAFTDAIFLDQESDEARTKFETWQNTIVSGIDIIGDKLKDLKDGASLDTIFEGADITAENWIDSLNQMSEACGWSVQQMQDKLNSLNLQADIEIVGKHIEHNVPQYRTERTDLTYDDYNNLIGWNETVTAQDPKPMDEYIEVASIGNATNPAKPAEIHYRAPSGGGGVSKSSTPSKNNSSSKEKKDKKSAEKETERYHEITALIEDYSKELEKAGKAKDRAFGPAKIKAMQAEIAAQAQLNAGTEEYIREIEEWLAIDKARIQAQGAIFDEYGNIANYTALMQEHIDKYNQAVATYNASSQDDAAKENFEKAEKAYEDFMEQLNQYEETNNLLQEQQDTLLDGLQQIYDLTTQKNQYIIEFKLEADDDAIAFIDYLKNKLENFTDGVNDAAEKLAYLNDEAARLMSKNSTYNEAIDMTLQHYLGDQKGWDQSAIDAYIERFKNNALTEADMSALEDMSEEEFNYLREMRDNLLEINNAMMENMSAVVETVQESFTKTAEDLDKATRPIERAASALENYAAIIDIVGRDALGITDAIAAELDNAAVAVAHSATVAAKAKVDTLQSERDEVQRLYDEAMVQGLTEMAYKWKTVLEEMDDEIAAATDDFNSKWQEELTKAREAFENTVERIKQSMLDAFAGSIGSWSALKDSLEYAKTAADRFVPQYKEIYELSKLNRDIMKSIDNTSNIKNKQALRDLQKEINELEQHSGEISQYDLDNARRRYELELARLQLEEARDAKSTVRLSKDSEGNWSYVYTANQDDVEKAEQNYEDKLYAMQQANNEYINSLSDQILELEEQYAEKLAEIRLDNTISEEERNAAIERLNAYFAEQMEYLTNEGQKAVDNNARLFEEEWTTYHNWTDAFGNDVQARIDNQHDFMTQFGDTILGTYTGYGNFDELNAAMVQIAEEASVKMEEAYGALQVQVATAMEAAGIDVAHFGEVVHDTVNDQIVPSAQAAEDAVVEMGKAAVDEFQKLTDGVSTWQTKYATEMQKIINKNEQLAISVNNLATAYANLVAQMYAAADAPTPKPVPKFNNSTADGYTDTGTGGSGGDGSSTGPGSPKPGSSTQDTWVTNPVWKSNNSSHWQISECTKGPSKGQTKKVNEGRHSWAIIGVISHGYGSSGAIPRSFDCECEICHKVITVPADKNYAMDDKGHILIPEYDTGGYTGDWNSSQGKLAILHEKELVLNKDDTKNILGTVEMVRKLSQKIDLNAQTARYAFNYHPIISDPKPIDRELQVDQTVTISAEFPNVQNRTEIEEAFTTLINQASQFANRKS